MLVGSIFGSLIGGLQCQFLGRKKSLIIDNLVVLAGLIGLKFSHSFLSLLICRFVHGVSVASLLVNIPSYTGEICQPKIRMITGSFVSVCISGGMCSMMLIGVFMKWRTAILVLSAFPIIIILLVIFIVPESPIWLVMNEKRDEAKKSLSTLRGNMAIVESELSKIQKSLGEQMSESYGKEKNSWFSGLRNFFGSLKDQSFLKPFSILLVLQAIGFEWVGLPFIAYYMVGILIDADIPFD